MLAPAREMHRKDHTSREKKCNKIAYRCTSHAAAKHKKVESDLKHEFITLAWPELQSPPCSGHGVHMLWLRLSRGRARGRRM